MPRQLKLVPERCIGCKSCEIACSLANGEAFNPAMSRITAITFLEGKYTLPYHFLSTCRQCADAPCLASCPVSAISRSADATRTVRVDEDLCIGCGKCVTACPFGMMFFNKTTRKPYKCELCDGNPACVDACPTEAIVFAQKKASCAQEQDLQMRGYGFLLGRNKENLRRKSAE